MIVLLCLPPRSSYSLGTSQPCVYLSVPQPALGQCYSRFSVSCLSSHRTSVQEQATELYSPGLHVGTLTTEPNFLLSEPGQDTEMYSFGKGGGEPLHPFLILFLFWSGRLQFSCRARLFKLDDQQPHVLQYFLECIRDEFQTAHKIYVTTQKNVPVAFTNVYNEY